MTNNNILILESDDNDFEEIANILLKHINTDENIVRCNLLEDSFLYPVSEIKIIIASLPFTGIANRSAVNLLGRHFENIPIIFLADTETNCANLQHEGFVGSCFLKKNLSELILKNAINVALKNAESIFKIELKHTDYKRHFHNSNIPMWIFDTDSLQILEVNNAASKKYGYTLEEFITLNILDLHPKEDIESYVELHENKDDFQFDAGYWRHQKKDGEVFFVNIYTHYTEHAGKETGLTYAFDVSDKLLEDLTHKNQQNLVKGQKEQFDSILSTLSDAIWSIRTDTLELIYANQAFYTLFAFTPEEMTADIDPFFSLIHPDDQKKFRQTMQGVSHSASANVEYRYYHRDGSQRTFQSHVTLIKGAEGKPDTLNGVTVDVTKERALQDKILKSEQNLLATINNTNDLIWSVNNNLEIIFCNKPYQDFIFKISKKAPRPGDYVLGEWGADEYSLERLYDYKKALAGETFSRVIEEEFAGEMVYKEISNNPIRDHEGKIVGVNCIARDVSEQRKQFVKIQEQNDRLIEIAWIQSHQVRAPVAKILGLAELFDPESANENNNELLDLIKQSTFELDQIIREVVEKTEVITQ